MDKAARRREILDTAYQVFAENGYSGTTMLEIARRAGASKETLYAWFDDKEKLLETLLRSRVLELSEQAPAAPDRRAAPYDTLYAMAHHMLTVTTRPAWIAMMRITIAEAPRFPALRRVMRRLLDHDDLAAYLADCRARRLMAFDDPAEMAALFISMVHGEWPSYLLFSLIDHVPPGRLAAHADLATRLFLKAVAPPRRPR